MPKFLNKTYAPNVAIPTEQAADFTQTQAGLT
jgi:hypothetical protein